MPTLNPALAIKELRKKIGDLDLLTTVAKSSLVSAINEVAQGGGGGGTSVQSDWNVTNPESLAYIKNKPTIPAAQIQSDWNQTSTVAKDYIKNKPTIPPSPVQSDWNQENSSALDYIKNKPNIPTPYTLPIAMTSTLGGIKPDDDTIKVNNAGIARAVIPYIPELYVSGTTLYISTEEQVL